MNALFGGMVNAQNSTQKIVIEKKLAPEDTALINPFSMWSTEFDVEDIRKMHEKIDSIFGHLDKDLNKRIRISAFDSIAGFYNGFDDFNSMMDSSFTHDFKMLGSDKRIEEILKRYQDGFNGRDIWNDSLFINPDSTMNLNIKTDTIIKDGEQTIIQRITINSKGLEDMDKFFGNNEPFTGAVHVNKESSSKRIVNDNKLVSTDYVGEITLKDAEILNKGGISPKLIVSPALSPDKQEVRVEVENEDGKEVKNVIFILDFEDKATSELIVLDKKGNRVFEEKKKNFSGELNQKIKIIDSYAPYYFLVIRNGQLYGKKILDIN